MIESKKRTHVELLDSLNARRISITALNSDSHSRRSIVKSIRRNDIETVRSCGVHPPLKSAALSQQFQPRFSPPSRRRPAAGVFFARARRRSPAAVRGAEFISVSGLRIDRSALRSDMRPSKRTSGVAAATLRPHAPMNSPTRTGSGHIGFTLHHSSIDA
jgi:hypothetical protein